MSLNFTIRGIDQFTKVFDRIKKKINYFTAGNLNKSAINKTKVQIANLDSQMQRIALSRQRYFANAVGGGIALMGFNEVIQSAVDFQMKMDEVRSKMDGFRGSLKNLSGENKKLFEELNDKAEFLGRTTLLQTTEVADGMVEFAKAGLDARQILDSISGGVLLSLAGKIDMGEVVDIGTNIATTFFGESNVSKKMANVVDILSLTTAKTNTDIIEMAEGMKFAGPVVAGLGVSLETTAAAMGVLANSGIKGTLAGTGIRRVFLRMLAPTKKSAETIKELGIRTETEEGKVVNIIDILAQLNEKTKELTESKKIKVFEQLFGKQGISSGMTLLRAIENGSFNKLKNSIADSEGVAKEMADTLSDNAYGSLKKTSSAVNGLSIAVGKTLLESYKELFQWISKIINKTTDWVKENKKLTAGFFTIAAALTVLFTALSAIGVLISTVMIGSLSLFVAIGKFKVLWLSLKPALLTIGGFISGITAPMWALIAAIVAAIALIIYHWKEVSTYIKKEFSPILESFYDTWNEIISLFGHSIKEIKTCKEEIDYLKRLLLGLAQAGKFIFQFLIFPFRVLALALERVVWLIKTIKNTINVESFFSSLQNLFSKDLKWVEGIINNNGLIDINVNLSGAPTGTTTGTKKRGAIGKVGVLFSE